MNKSEKGWRHSKILKIVLEVPGKLLNTLVMENPREALSRQPMENNLNLNTLVERYRQRAVIAIQTAFLIGATLVLVLISDRWQVILAIVTCVFFSVSSLWLAWKGKIVIAAMILGAQFLILPTYLALEALGTYDSVILLFPAGLMAISLVGKPYQTALFSVLTLLCAGIIALATFNNRIGNKVLFSLMSSNPVDIISTMAIIGFSCVVATYVSVILTRVLNKLADHQMDLEDKILRRTRDLATSNDELRLAITHLDKARAELVRGEKLAGLGSLVAGVSHELNTPIGNTAVAATTLLDVVDNFKKLADEGTLRKADLARFLSRCTEGAELIVSSTHRARDLVSSFKQVAVDQTSDRRRNFKLDEVVNDVLRTMRPSFKGHDWVIDCNVASDINCDGYPGPLGQVITNLIQNAVFHGFSDRLHGHIQIDAKLLAGDQVQVIVRDDGKGIAEESIGKIFDPFFTTRLGQGGSGLGLTIVHNLVTAMLCGRIEVASTLGKGAQFTLTFPSIAPQAAGFE